jgi:hypothetical protein
MLSLAEGRARANGVSCEEFKTMLVIRLSGYQAERGKAASANLIT